MPEFSKDDGGESGELKDSEISVPSEVSASKISDFAFAVSSTIHERSTSDFRSSS
jgi:hypothetical protein